MNAVFLNPPPPPPVSAVSMMAAQEYEGMKEQLDLEQSLRVKAETYAHEVKSESQKCGYTGKHQKKLKICLFLFVLAEQKFEI